VFCALKANDEVSTVMTLGFLMMEAMAARAVENLSLDRPKVQDGKRKTSLALLSIMGKTLACT
jgi:hypothetical protein